MEQLQSKEKLQSTKTKLVIGSAGKDSNQ